MLNLPKVYVMMATYNGEKYLREQIDSILAQEDVEVTLRICDDCSSDSTFEICNEYQQKDNRVIATQNAKGLGVGLNFMQMVYEINAADYDYFAFSDQDDYWLPQKLILAYHSIQKIQSDSTSKHIDGLGVPVLYCSDLKDVDSELNNPVSELACLKLDLTKRATPLIRNYYSGCTMVMNRAMVLLLQSHVCDEFPRIHDAWCAMVAYYCGNFIVDIDHAEILRRITGCNTVGALVPGKDIQNASFGHLANKPQRDATRAAALLYDGYSAYLSDKDRVLINSFIRDTDSFSGRLKWVLSSDYAMTTKRETLLARIKFLLGRF